MVGLNDRGHSGAVFYLYTTVYFLSSLSQHRLGVKGEARIRDIDISPRHVSHTDRQIDIITKSSNLL